MNLQATGLVSSPGAGRAGMSRPRIRRAHFGIATLKFVLPLVAAAIVAYIVYWWWAHSRDRMIAPETVQAATNSDAPVTVDRVKFDGKDDRGRPYTILAESASHPQGDSKRISLVKPSADIILSGGAYVAIRADRGLLDRAEDRVTLEGQVHLLHDSGLSFETETAEIDLETKIASGQSPVEGQNRDGELIAEGFRILDDGRVVQFTGRAFLKLYGGSETETGRKQ